MTNCDKRELIERCARRVPNALRGSILIVAIFHGTLDITMSSPAGPEIANVMGALVTFWGLGVLAWAGPKNLSSRRRKQDAPGLSSPGAMDVEVRQVL